MLLNKINKTNEIPIKILNISICLIPLAFIIGNFAINILSLSILLFGIFQYWKEIIYLNNFTHIRLLLAFFLLVFFNTIVESFFNYNQESLLRSFLFFRYFFIILIIFSMMNKAHLNLKLFLISSFTFSFLVSLNIIFQYIDLNFIKFINYETPHISGIFNDEKIAGSYIQKFFLISCFIILITLKKNKSAINNYLIFLFMFLIPLTAILISGNRMPFLSSVLFVSLGIFVFKELRKEFISIFLLISIIFITVIKFDKRLSHHYQSFYENIFALVPNITLEMGKEHPDLEKTDITFTNNYYNEITIKREDYEVYSFGTGHAKLYTTAIDIWNDRILLGNGIKSFRIKCKEKEYLPNRSCGNHPHNYHLEILVDTGLIGYFVLLLAFINIVIKELTTVRASRLNINQKNLFYCFLLNFIVEFFFFKSTGSFFTTSNATFIFLSLSLIIGYLKYIKNNK